MNNGLKLAFGALLAIGTMLPANAIILEFNPSSQSVSVGSTTTVDLVISGLVDGAAPSLGTFDLDVGFDSSILSFTGATFGNQLDLFGLGSLPDVIAGVGTVNLFEISLDLPDDLDTLQAGSFVLASLTFDALASGSSDLSISVNALGDSLGDPLQADVIEGTIRSEGAVPEPASLPLIGIGMLGMIALAMRRRRKFAHY